MGVFRSVGFQDDSIESFVEYLNNTNHENYTTNKATFKDKCFHYVLVDDALELWTQHLPVDENSKYLYFSLTDGCMHEVENLEEDKDVISSSHQIFKFNMHGVSYPIIAEFPKGCIPEIKEGKNYRITMAGAASEVVVYKSYEDFEHDFYDIDVRSIAPTVNYSAGIDPISMACIHMNGYVKDFEKRTNSYTHNSYYKITVSSFQYDYVVYADENDVDSNIAKNDIISVTARMFGRFEFQDPGSYFMKWHADYDYEFFCLNVTPILLGLKPIFYDFFVLDFDSKVVVDEIEFIQTIIDRSDGKYILEIKKNTDGIKFLYRLERLKWNEVLKVFYDLCINHKAPDLSKWEDVSDEIFKDRKIDSTQSDSI